MYIPVCTDIVVNSFFDPFMNIVHVISQALFTTFYANSNKIHFKNANCTFFCVDLLRDAIFLFKFVKLIFISWVFVTCT